MGPPCPASAARLALALVAAPPRTGVVGRPPRRPRPAAPLAHAHARARQRVHAAQRALAFFPCRPPPAPMQTPFTSSPRSRDGLIVDGLVVEVSWHVPAQAEQDVAVPALSSTRNVSARASVLSRASKSPTRSRWTTAQERETARVGRTLTGSPRPDPCRRTAGLGWR
jgi:hypothetical protein